MIVVPYPHARGHQAYNAAPYVEAGAAVLLDDADCTPPRLCAEIEALVADQPRWQAMAEASLRMGRPDAAERVADLVGEAAAHRSRRP